ncbi:DUF6093 family protein [Streptomyces sp. NPDC057740]|uniref:DUF6093 family protein n=1 Tax=Streptomyces sp. NPDC057740 TaxID=3346234 RepID=UPI0036B3B2F3
MGVRGGARHWTRGRDHQTRVRVHDDLHVRGEATTDDVLDEATGQLRSPCTDRELLWTGRGAIVPLGGPAVVEPLDGATAPVPPSTAYKALLPVDAPPSRPGDLLTVVHSVRDDQLVDRWFRVSDAAVGSFAVVRVIRLQPATRSPQAGNQPALPP